jgi:tetratricopeptide (TPR) repeat protein
MFKNKIILYSLFLLVLSIYVSSHGKSWEDQLKKKGDTYPEYILPAQFTAISSLGNSGLYADFLFLKVLNFVGHHILWQQSLNQEDWRYIEQSIDTITDLDPNFLDPYFFAEGFFTWEVGKYDLANRILLKAVDHLRDDWQFPYFVGFNYYYFLKDYEKGAEYMMQAAKIPGSPSFVATLAPRLAYYGGDAAEGIAFLRDFLAVVKNPALEAALKKSITVLESAAVIEAAVKTFKTDHGRNPHVMNELVSKGYLKEMPIDPYGGRWGILQSGRVFSTSKFADSPVQKVTPQQ